MRQFPPRFAKFLRILPAKSTEQKVKSTRQPFWKQRNKKLTATHRVWSESLFFSMSHEGSCYSLSHPFLCKEHSAGLFLQGLGGSDRNKLKMSRGYYKTLLIFKKCKPLFCQKSGASSNWSTLQLLLFILALRAAIWTSVSEQRGQHSRFVVDLRVSEQERLLCPHENKKHDFNWFLPWQCDLVGREPGVCTAESALGARMTRGPSVWLWLYIYWFNVCVSADWKKQRVIRTVHLSCRAYSAGWEWKAVD